MDLPPPWYALLLGFTLASLPLLARRASRDQTRRLLRFVILGLALIETGLILLHYSTLLCWPLVSIGAAIVAGGVSPRRQMSASVAVLAVGFAAGFVFEWNPDAAGFVRYFAIGFPLTMAAPVAILAASWLRWDASRSATASAIGVAAFVGLIGFSAFAFDFLVLFEVVHLPALAGFLGALAWLASVGSRAVEEAKRDVLTAETVGEYVGRPPSPARRLVVPALTVSLGILGTGLLVTVLVYQTFSWPVVASVALFAVGAVTVLVEKSRIPSATALFAAALLMPLTPMRLLGVPDVLTGMFLLAGAAAATSALVGGAAAWAYWLDRSRRVVATQQSNLPPIVAQGHMLDEPSVRDLERVAARMRASGAESGVARVEAPDAWWTVSDEVYEWLVLQEPPRLHLLIQEPDGIQILPPFFPEDAVG